MFIYPCAYLMIHLMWARFVGFCAFRWPVMAETAAEEEEEEEEEMWGARRIRPILPKGRLTPAIIMCRCGT
jgi:hypothetical protein